MDSNEIDPLDGTFDDVVDSVINPAPIKALKNMNNNEISTGLAAPVQLPLDLGIEVEKTVGGLEMGVLQNGLPYLTQKGLFVSHHIHHAKTLASHHPSPAPMDVSRTCGRSICLWPGHPFP